MKRRCANLRCIDRTLVRDLGIAVAIITFLLFHFVNYSWGEALTRALLWVPLGCFAIYLIVQIAWRIMGLVDQLTHRASRRKHF